MAKQATPGREQMGNVVPIGIIQRVVAGMRYAITGVGPDNFFGPSQPLAPAAQDRAQGRAFDYPVGYNLRIDPRSGEAISFQQLRYLADGYDLMRLIIETRKDQLEAYEWEIVPADPDVAESTMKDAIYKASEFLQKPNRESDWPEWLRMLAEELLVIDAVCVYPRLNRGGGIYSLDIVDGSTIKKLIDDEGRTPEPPDPAYQQVLKGIPAVDYTAEELVYLSRNKRAWKIYGYSPVEQVIMTVNIALRRQMHQLQSYTEGNVPEALAQVPDAWTADELKEFQTWFDSKLAGNTAQRRRINFVPKLEGLLFTKQDSLKDEYDEWLARIVCFAFSVPPTAFIRQNNRATGEQAAETAKEEGLLPLLTWVARKMTNLVQGPMGYKGLKFQWKMQVKIDPKAEADMRVAYVGAQILTVDEAREEIGKSPLTDAQREELFPPTPDPVEQAAAIAAAKSGIALSPEEKGAVPAATKPKELETKPAEKLAKAKRVQTKVGKYVRKNEDALTKTILVTLRQMAKDVASQFREMEKAESPDEETVVTAVDTELLLADLKRKGYVLKAVQKITPAMIKAYKAAGINGVLELNLDVTRDITNHMDEYALDYAEERSALLVTGITETTEKALQGVIAKGVEQGMSTNRLADEIEKMGAFSESRARMIARTELAYAHVQGNVEGWRQTGLDVMKESLLGDLHDIQDECDDCADAGPVPLDAEFIDGYDFPPYHPSCLCDIKPVVSPDEGD